MATYTVVSTHKRPDLSPMTALWRWEAFFRDSGVRVAQTAASNRLMPQSPVLLKDNTPIGTSSLTEHDFNERPNLSPWLTGVFVAQHARGRGNAATLIAAMEAQARPGGDPNPLALHEQSRAPL